MSDNPIAARQDLPIAKFLSQADVKEGLSRMLGQRRATQLASNLITVVSNNYALKKCRPDSVLAAAAQATILDLSIVPSIGHAAVVPYKDEAQFQIMSRGIVQLALRTGKYRKIHLAEVFEGQLVKYDEFTGEIKLNAAGKKSDKIEGFFFFFELDTGFRHETYWSVRKCIAHGWRYSKAFSLFGKGPWTEDPLLPKKRSGDKDIPDLEAFKGLCTPGSGLAGMCAKTVVKNTIAKWGPMTTDLQEAIASDQAVIRGDQKVYVDSTTDAVSPDNETTPEKKERAAPRRASEKKAAPIDVEAEKSEASKTEHPPQPGRESHTGKTLGKFTGEIREVRVTKVGDPERNRFRIVPEGDGAKDYLTFNEEDAKVAKAAAAQGTLLTIEYSEFQGNRDAVKVYNAESGS